MQHDFTAAGIGERNIVEDEVGAAGRQDHRCSGSQSPSEFDTDLAAAAQDEYRTRTRVVHGCDYHLR